MEEAAVDTTPINVNPSSQNAKRKNLQLNHTDKMREQQLQSYESQIDKFTNNLTPYFLEFIDLAYKEVDNHNLLTTKRKQIMFSDFLEEQKRPAEPEKILEYMKDVVEKLILNKNRIAEEQLSETIINEEYQDLAIQSYENQIKNLERNVAQLKINKQITDMKIDDLTYKNNYYYIECEKMTQLINNFEYEKEYQANQEFEKIHKLEYERDQYKAQLKKLEAQAMAMEFSKNPAMTPIQSKYQNSKQMSDSKVLTPLVRPQTSNYLGDSYTNKFIQKKDYKSIQSELISANQNYQHEQHEQQYVINRLEIQANQKEKQIKRLQKDFDMLAKEMKKMKEQIADEERKAGFRRVTVQVSEADALKKEKFELEKEIRWLGKCNKRFAIQEKKLFLKEKMFENERADYQDKLMFLKDRANKLMKYIEDNHIPSHNKDPNAIYKKISQF